jgi:hypothetical protein
VSQRYEDEWGEETRPSRRVRPEDDLLAEPGAEDAWAETVAIRAPSPEDDGQRAEDRVSPSVIVWLLGFSVLALSAIVVGLWVLYSLRGEWSIEGPTPTPIIWTPTPAPTSAATPTSPAPTATPAAATPTVSPAILIGGYVRVTGTGGQGLNLRAGPGANYTRMTVAPEGRVLLVVDGPTVAGGSEWWQLADPEAAAGDDAQRWWAVANYLEPAEGP